MREKNMGKWALKFVLCLVGPFLTLVILPLILGIPEYLPFFMAPAPFIAVFLFNKWVGPPPR